MIYTDELARIAREQNHVCLATIYRWKKRGQIPDNQLLKVRPPITSQQTDDLDLLLTLNDMGYIQGWTLAPMMGRHQTLFADIVRNRRNPAKYGLAHQLRKPDIDFVAEHILNPLRELATHLSSRITDAGDGKLPDLHTLALVRNLLGFKGVRIKRLCNGFSHADYMRMRHLCMYQAIWTIFDKPLLLKLGQHLATIPYAVQPQRIPRPAPDQPA